MINFARLLLFPGQTNALSGLFESDWDYGRAIHFAAPQALIRQFDTQTLSEIAPSILWQQGVVSAADIAISADWRFELYNQGTITNRLFLTLTEGGHAMDGRYAITGSAYADQLHNAGRIEGAVLLDAGALALSKDRSTEAAPRDWKFGRVLDLDGHPTLGDAMVVRVHQEHGEVRAADGATLP